MATSTGKRPHFIEFLLRVCIWAGVAMLLCLGGLWVQSWRVDRRWQEYRQAALAKGRILDLPADPPAIPAALNFAGEPPFAIIPVDEDGKPTQPASLPTDWLPKELLPDIAKGERPDFVALGAKLAVPLKKEAEVARAVLKLCDEHLAAQWPRVLAAEAKPQVRFGNHHWPLPVMEKLPIADLRTAAQVHVIRAAALFRLRRGAEAVQELQGGLRIAEALSHEPGLIACMMRSAIIGFQMNGVWDGLAQGAWSDADLATLEQELASLHVSTSYSRAMDTERGWHNAMHDTLANLPPWARASEVRRWFPDKGVFPILLASWCSWEAMVRDEQLVVNRHFDVVRQQIDASGNWQPTELPFDYDRLSRSDRFRYALASISLASYSRAERHLLAMEARVRQARLAIAVERFRRAHRALPAQVEGVVPKFLPAMLLDPYDGAPMRYARDAANRYRLWSTGDDRKDDGGQPDPELIDVKLDLVWPGSVPGK